MRRVIERELDSLHRRLPKRWWLSYAWLGGGLGVGLALSQLPLVTALGSAVRLAQLGIGLAATVKSMQRVLARSSSAHEPRLVGGENGHARGPRLNTTERSEVTHERA
jgi:hypothetical protein